VHSAAVRLLDRDVVFLCTDEHWGRSVVNEVAYQYMIPVINMGAAIKAQDGTIAGATGPSISSYPTHHASGAVSSFVLTVSQLRVCLEASAARWRPTDTWKVLTVGLRQWSA
jgi:hypothetical protein